MRYLRLSEVIEIYRRVIDQTGGAFGIRDLAALESCLAQPRMTFDGRALYPTLIEKAAALGHSLMANHPFLDENKRTGHASMEAFLYLNGFEVVAKETKRKRWFSASLRESRRESNWRHGWRSM